MKCQDSILKQFRLLNRFVYTEDITKSEDFRNYNFDMNPKFIYAKSKSTEELSSSNASSYLEFSSVKNIFFYFQGKSMSVPFSKSEIFTSQDLDLLEKQKLLAFLYSIMKIKNKEVDVNSTTDIQKDYELDNAILLNLQSNLLEQSDKFLKQHFPNKIQSMIQLILANTDPNCQSSAITVDEMTTKIYKFLLSLQIYDNTPFLYPSYGSSEFTQALCRLGAVHGAIFLVNETLKINVDLNSNLENEQSGCKYSIAFNDEENKQKFNLKVKNIVINEIYLSDLSSSVQLSSNIVNRKNSSDAIKPKLLKYICFVSIKNLTQLRKNNSGLIYYKIMKNDAVLNNLYGFTAIEYFHNTNSVPRYRSLLQIYINTDEDVKEEIFAEKCKGIIEDFVKRRLNEIEKEIKDYYDSQKDSNELQDKLISIEVIDDRIINITNTTQEKSDDKLQDEPIIVKEPLTENTNIESNTQRYEEKQKENEIKSNEDLINIGHDFAKGKKKKEIVSLTPVILFQYEFIQVISDNHYDLIKTEDKSSNIFITKNDYVDIDLDYYYIECESIVKSESIAQEAKEIPKESEERLNKSNMSDDTNLIDELFNSISLTKEQPNKEEEQITKKEEEEKKSETK